MTRKLFVLCLLLLILGGLFAVATPVSACNGCPPNGCPLPGSSAASYCQSQCQGANPYYQCYQQCYNGVEGQAQTFCKNCGFCCNY